jgi:hypothetical protein
MEVAPTNSRKLRSAIESEAPAADLIWVVSAVRCGIEEGGRQRDQMREHVAPEIGDDALAKRHHQIVPRGAGAGEHRDHGDHDAEIAVDHGDALRGEAEVDHPPHRDRHHESSDRGDRERDQGERGAPAIARHIGRQRQQRPEPRIALRRLPGQRLIDGRGLRRCRRRRITRPFVQPFHCAHEIEPIVCSPR